MRPDIRARKEAEEAFTKKTGGIIQGKAWDELAKLPQRGWPRCDECRAPASTVATHPGNWIHGVYDQDNDEPEALFCCPEHPDALRGWYWIDIGARDRKNVVVRILLWNRDMLTHLSEKSWGPRFIAWLLENYDLAEHAEMDAIRAWQKLS